MGMFKFIEVSLLVLLLIFNLFLVSYFINPEITSNVIFLDYYEKKAPSNFIEEDQIYSENNKLVIDISNFTLSRYCSSNSMVPILNENSTGVSIKPANSDSINVGDIISYWKDNEIIVHRVVKKDKDDEGFYFIAKGDSAESSDKNKIRFNDIDSVLIAIIY
jgi:signal peptidase I